MDGAGRPTTEHRRTEAELRQAHLEAQQPVIEQNRQAREELDEFARMPLNGERADVARRRAQKSAPGAPENKALAGPGENKADLDAMTKAELEKMAKKQGVEVEGTGSGGNVLKADLVKALGG